MPHRLLQGALFGQGQQKRGGQAAPSGGEGRLRQLRVSACAEKGRGGGGRQGEHLYGGAPWAGGRLPLSLRTGSRSLSWCPLPGRLTMKMGWGTGGRPEAFLGSCFGS